MSATSQADGTITAQANYVVYRTQLDAIDYGHSELFSVGELSGGTARGERKCCDDFRCQEWQYSWGEGGT